MLWHHDRPFELILDTRAKTLVFPDLLPAVPRNSAMYRDLKRFVESRQSEELPPHRRVDAARARLPCANRSCSVSVGIAALDQDFEYSTRQLIHTVHEIFLIFPERRIVL